MAIAITVTNKQFLIPETGDPCELWRAYFTQLKKELGTENARMIWLITWGKNGNNGCTTNAEFNRFLKQQKIDVSSAATRAVADVTAMGSGLLGLGKNLTNVLSIGVPIALSAILLVIILLLFNTARKSDATDLAMVLPAGKVAKGMGAIKMLKG